MHFGSSKRQISLHTGVAYSGQDVISFCTASDSLKHGPGAIWAHLEPVILHLKRLRSDTTGLHFISDGPTTQYRNKQNFYLWSKKMKEYGFTQSTWNFLEAGHGKGAADGIGAAVKGNADSQVNVKGKDITCAKDIVTSLTEGSTKIKLFEVNDDCIAAMEATIPQTLTPIQNTMKVHQLVYHDEGAFSSRYLSCFCSYPQTLLCSCFQSTRCTLSAKNLSGNQHLSDIENGKSVTTGTNKIAAPMLTGIDDIGEHLVSRYCVVSYDEKPYPGIIISVDDEGIEVKVMHCVGKNRYFWPRMEDILWYKPSSVITSLEKPPQQVTNRHMKIDDSVWKCIEEHFDI